MMGPGLSPGPARGPSFGEGLKPGPARARGQKPGGFEGLLKYEFFEKKLVLFLDF